MRSECSLSTFFRASVSATFTSAKCLASTPYSICGQKTRANFVVLQRCSTHGLTSWSKSWQLPFLPPRLASSKCA